MKIKKREKNQVSCNSCDSFYSYKSKGQDYYDKKLTVHKGIHWTKTFLLYGKFFLQPSNLKYTLRKFSESQK